MENILLENTELAVIPVQSDALPIGRIFELFLTIIPVEHQISPSQESTSTIRLFSDYNAHCHISILLLRQRSRILDSKQFCIFFSSRNIRIFKLSFWLS